MKRLVMLVVSLSLILMASVCLAGGVDLVGTWQGPISLHGAQAGFVSNDGTNGQMIIAEQKNGAFAGEKVWTRNGKDRVEAFSGVISPDGKKFYMAGHDDGYFVGDILGPNEIVLYYLEDGGSPKAIRWILKRIK